MRRSCGRSAPHWRGSCLDGTGAVAPRLASIRSWFSAKAMVRLLRRLGDGAGCLLVLDDLHWADVDTVALVEFLAGAVGSSAVLVVGAVTVR